MSENLDVEKVMEDIQKEPLPETKDITYEQALKASEMLFYKLRNSRKSECQLLCLLHHRLTMIEDCFGTINLVMKKMKEDMEKV